MKTNGYQAATPHPPGSACSWHHIWSARLHARPGEGLSREGSGGRRAQNVPVSVCVLGEGRRRRIEGKQDG